MTLHRPWIALLVALACAAGLLLTAGPAAAADTEVLVLSNRADLLSGGDALVEVVLPDGASADGMVVDVDGRDVTDAFAAGEDGRLIGLVEGLTVGDNVVTATLADGSGARITLTDHPVGGPIFSGPHLDPWICTTGQEGLGDPIDEACNVEPVYDYQYWSTEDGGFAAYDPDSPPDDVAETTTDEGMTVPYIVRREQGAINRGLYAIAVLWDPAADAAVAPADPPAWNHKLFYPFGASCNTNYNQGSFGGFSVLDDKALSRGFAVATSTLNILGQHCNAVLSAETMMMVKERLIERYGEVRYTYGEGGSGGSIGQLMVSNAYPGLLQGLIPSQTFPDNWTTSIEVQDCHLLNLYFNAAPHLWLDPAQQTAVNGHESTTSCLAWEALFAQVQDPQHGCGLAPVPGDASAIGVLPTAGVRTPDDYNPVTNPEGCRATVQDIGRNIWGLREEDGFAALVDDNEGVQYGLEALAEGTISPAQFVDLNVNIGGLDIDHMPTAERSVADPGTPEIGHRTGAANDGARLDQVAIIDLPPTLNAEIHTPYHAQALEQRLIAAHGTGDNHAIWRGGDGLEAFLAMDEWLSAVEADTSGAPLAERIIANRPGSAVDSCFVDGEQVTDVETCDAEYPYYGDARLAAGAPLAHDVLKCTLEPHVREDYPVELTDAEFAALDEVFADGVCDWTQPGVGQVTSVGWLTFAGGPGGQPLGEPPTSTPFGPGGVTVDRFAGPDRIATSVAVSGRGVAEAGTVVIARADDYPDALAGGPLATALGAPLLLTAPDGLDRPVADEIRRLGATEAVLLGGEGALSAAVATAVEDLGLTVTRLEGPDRFGTAAAIAAAMPADAGEVLIARGDDFADALAASGLGAALGLPVLLVEPGRLPDPTADALSAAVDATVIGGESAVGADVAAAVDAAAGEVERLSGSTRYGTAAAVAGAAVQRGVSPAVTWVATGRAFPDALVAGAAAGRDGGLLVLVDGQDLAGSPETRDLLAGLEGLSRVRVAGGTAAVSDAVLDGLRGLLAG